MTTIPHTAPSARPIQRRRKPTPEAILRTYNAELHRGRRGAYRRTGDLLGVSDETVRRVVHRAEQPPEMPLEDATLAYEPPPGAYPMPQPVPQPVSIECGDIMSNASSDVANMPQMEDATRHTDELPEMSPEVLEPPQPEPEAEPAPASEPESPETPISPPDIEPQMRSMAPRLYARPTKTPQPVPQPDPLPLPEPVPIPDPFPTPTPDPIPVPPMPGPNPVQASPIVVRQIVRVPVEPHRGGVVAWCVEHEAAAKQLAAVMMFLVLVALTWLG